MPALILEGGTMRPIFSCGVMDALLDNDIMFDYVSGVSAGITYAFSYLSKQHSRNLNVLTNYRNDKRYISVRNYPKYRSLFGLDFVFDEVPNKIFPFDWDTFYQYKGKVLVGVTNAETGKAEYLNGMEIDKPCTMLRATCAIPYYFPEIKINGNSYYDGGLADSIPVAKSLDDGNRKHLIVLTRPEGYRKKTSLSTKAAVLGMKRRYPNLSLTMANRANMYNETLALCDALKKRAPDDTVILRPHYPLHSFESNIDRLKANYQHGYDMTVKNINQIKNLFK